MSNSADQGQGIEGWAERHPLASGTFGTTTAAGLAISFGREASRNPDRRISNLVMSASLTMLAVASAVETVRPDTFRLWDRMQNIFDNR